MRRVWKLHKDDPLALRLAADVRFGTTDYADDQIWELNLADLVLETRYGGRGWAKIQLQFDKENGRFPCLTHFYPNYLQINLNKTTTAEFWAVNSHVMAIRLTGEIKLDVTYGVEGLRPVLLRENGRYVLASRITETQSQQLAQAVLAQDWDAALTHIHSVNQNTPQIETGDPDWDATLALAFKVSLQSYVGPTEHFPNPSFIFTRIPERGYSALGDGSDHNWQWDGQVATEAYVNLPIVAYAAPDIAKGIIRNYLAIQREDGFIDWKPGLAGQRSGWLCIPLLTATCWHIYQITEDADFLREVHEGLNRFLAVWYLPSHDRDQDGVPEWDDTIQSAFDDQPAFVRYRAWAQRADVTKVETPDLMAYLYRAHRDMQKIEQVLGIEPNPVHEQRAAHLQAELAKMWHPVTRSFHFRDRDSHALPTHVWLLEMENEGGLTAVSHPLSTPLPQPNRALVRLQANHPQPKLPYLEITIEGINAAGWSATEMITADSLTWYRELGSATGDVLWQFIERVHITGMDKAITQVELLTPDLSRQDQTLLLPLWAGMVEETRLPQFVKRTITDPRRYWRRYGMPNCSALDPAYQADNRNGSGGVWMMWNTMIGEGLVRHGYRDEAADLITRLMTAMIHTLKTEKCFREAYNPDKLEGLGDRDYLWGVAPCHLFLQTVGIRIVNKDKVTIEGYNPFPWPITVRHHGVAVTRQPGRDGVVDVQFPEGVAGQIIRQQ
jgi:hypothetical protein